MKIQSLLAILLLRFVALVFVVVSVPAWSQTTPVIVQPGDHIGSIAQRYLTSPATSHWKKIIELNRLQAPFVVRSGKSLLLPTEHFASQLVQARLVRSTGSVEIVRGSDAALASRGNAELSEGDRVVTKSGSSAVVQLADGSLVTVLPESSLLLSEHRYFLGRAGATGREGPTGTQGFSGLLRLLQGSIETRAMSSNDRAKPLRIQTPTSVVGVRGTAFRVTHDAVDVALQTRIEVTQGLVQAELDPQRQTGVQSGFGVLMNPASSAPPSPVLLLDAPLIDVWAKHYDRPMVELAPLPSTQGQKTVRGYRVQIGKAADAAQAAPHDMSGITFDRRFAAQTPILVPNLPDGVWQLRARAIDQEGIEGKDAYALITLKARPEPPIIQAPNNHAKATQKQGVHLVWANHPQATAYQLELLSPSGERAIYVSKEANYHLTQLKAGLYQWRLATQKQMDQGPWSDPQYFTVMAEPEPAQGALDAAQKTLLLRWSDQKAASYDIEISREADFSPTSTLVQKTLKPNTALINPESGRHYIRYRAIALDGFISGWSDVIEVVVPPNWTHLLIYLGGGTRQWP